MSEPLLLRAERLSALVDGQLGGAEFTQAIDELMASPQARQDWDTYHLVSAALRSRSAVLRAHDPAFVALWRARLAREEGLALQPTPAALLPPGLPQAPVRVANDHWWRRVVGVAALAGVSFGLWQGWYGIDHAAPQGNGVAQLAPAATPHALAAASSQDAALMLRDPRLDALLAAHRQHGGVTALQMPAVFLRNATFDEGHR